MATFKETFISFCKKVQSFLTKDYCIHALYIFALSMFALIFLPWWAVIIFSAAVSVGKEILDYVAYGGFSLTDLAGDAVGLMAALLVDVLVRVV